MKERDFIILPFVGGMLLAACVGLLLPEPDPQIVPVRDAAAEAKLAQQAAETEAALEKAKQDAAESERVRTDLVAQLAAAKATAKQADPANHVAPAVPDKIATEPRKYLPWVYSLDDAKRLSRETGRPIYIAFTRTGCQPCKLVRRSIYEGPLSKRICGEFVPLWICVTVDSRGRTIEDADKQLADTFNVQRFPEAAVARDGNARLFVPDSDPAKFAGQLDAAMEAMNGR